MTDERFDLAVGTTEELFGLLHLGLPEQRDYFLQFDEKPNSPAQQRTGLSNCSVPLPRVD